MFSSPTKDQAASLAGVFQSAMLVHQLANRDQHDAAALRGIVLSVLRVEAESVQEIYGSLNHLAFGFRVMEKVFQGKLGDVSRNLFQYSVGMHQLAAKLDTQPSMSEAIHQGLVDINTRYPDADLFDGQADEERWLLYEDIASLYAKTMSTMQPRIMVRGSEGRLNNPQTVNRVRSALFAGIRSAWLWQQMGGKRWHLLLHRKRYLNWAQRLGGH